VAERTEDFARILIFGNSGSGKSWLSRQLGKRLKIAPIDLDTVHWEPGGFQVARDTDVARAIARQIASQDVWIMEGVYGWLAREILNLARYAVGTLSR
jgi:adenylate kinase family enzyme